MTNMTACNVFGLFCILDLLVPKNVSNEETCTQSLLSFLVALSLYLRRRQIPFLWDGRAGGSQLCICAFYAIMHLCVLCICAFYAFCAHAAPHSAYTYNAFNWCVYFIHSIEMGGPI